MCQWCCRVVVIRQNGWGGGGAWLPANGLGLRRSGNLGINVIRNCDVRRIFKKDKPAMAQKRCYAVGFPTNMSPQTLPVSTSDSIFYILFYSSFNILFLK